MPNREVGRLTAGAPPSSATVGDIRIAYEVKGTGVPLVMIMGLGGNLDWWDPRLIQGLSGTFKTIRFDNRGTGRTDTSDQEYTLHLLADDTAGLMEALGIPKAHVLGISMGGMIAQELALNHPEKVDRLVLCSTNCGGSKSIPPAQEALAILAHIATASSAEDVARMTVPLCFTQAFMDENKEEIEHWTQQILKAPTSRETYFRQVGAIAAFNAYDRLPGIKVPTLVLHGKRDILVPPENGSILAEVIPNARLVYLEHSAHGLSEDVDRVLQALTEFLLPFG